jgi:tripeptidyl-peptidase-1
MYAYTYKIAETFSASADSIAAVKEWLTDSGIAAERIGLSKSRNWIKFNATVDEAESLLRTQYGIYTNSETGKDHLACESYSMPPHIQAHVDFIKPTVHFDAYATPTRKRRGLQGRSTSERSLDVKPIQIVHPGPDLGPVPEIQYNLTNCYQYTTPECLRALYNLPNGTLALSVYSIHLRECCSHDKGLPTALPNIPPSLIDRTT